MDHCICASGAALLAFRVSLLACCEKVTSVLSVSGAWLLFPPVPQQLLTRS